MKKPITESWEDINRFQYLLTIVAKDIADLEDEASESDSDRTRNPHCQTIKVEK